MINRDKLYSGKRYTLYAITENGECSLQNFISGLTVINQRKIVALLEHTAQNGTPTNLEKFKQLEKLDNISLFEFKAGQVRVLCTFDGQSIIVLTHGFIKKQQKTRRSEIDRAFRLLRLYRERFRDADTCA